MQYTELLIKTELTCSQYSTAKSVPYTVHIILPNQLTADLMFMSLIMVNTLFEIKTVLAWARKY
jgi:hypothetical protein